MSQIAWIIPLLPFAAFVLIGLGARRNARLSAGLTILGVTGALVLSVLVFAETLAGGRVDQTYPWIPLPGGLAFPVGFQVDPLTVIMLVVASSVSFLVQIYSTGYMHGDKGYARYFAAMALFTASMLGLVLANNLLTIYIFWELVGLCSYLLIGHWHERPEAAAAAKKAFLVTRFGDFGFLVGILFLYAHTGTFDFSALTHLAESGGIPDSVITIGMLLVFCGAVGKSAQFPLHVWLPDAMEGPTPVSALIHAATMVAAGVYLMARTSPILEHSALAMAVVATIGGFTAIFAATMGLVAPDIKRVLAFSTMSQLGYMMLAIGVGATSAGMFHLFNHAFFKALLFLGAGSVIHLVNTNDIFAMGGLQRWRPITYLTMLFASLSLAGIPPFSGFWSKDEILVATANHDSGLYIVAMITVFLTAFYMFRVIFVTFTGSYRGPHPEHLDEHPEPPSMTVPLLILVVPTIISGLWGSPWLGNAFGAFIEGHPVETPFRLDVAGVSTLLALAGIGIAWQMYGNGRLTAGAQMTARFAPVYRLLMDRYHLDHLYGWLAGQAVVGIGWLASQFDRNVIDGIVNGIGRVAVAAGRGLRQVQSGQVQTYALLLFVGVLTLALVAAVWR